MTDDHRDELPSELDPSAYVGPYTFPNNNRRRIHAVIYLAAAAICIGLWVAFHDGGVLVNDGLLYAGIGFVLIAVFNLAAGATLQINETDALVAATRNVGFPVGHASAQLGWRGFVSRPTWRILLYSAEDPPERRGMVLVDGIDGSVLGDYVEKNPEDWSQLR